MACGKKKGKGKGRKTRMGFAVIAFFSYEIANGGMSKICVYDSPYGQHSINVASYQFCPYTIEVD